MTAVLVTCMSALWTVLGPALLLLGFVLQLARELAPMVVGALAFWLAAVHYYGGRVLR